MKTRVSLSTIFRCSLERAFKTPMLCDVSKVHTGFGVMPRVTHCTEDADWGKVGAKKRVFAAKAWTFGGGEVSSDRVIERVENDHWVIEVADFRTWMLGFDRLVGEWKTTALGPDEIRVDYTYTLHAPTPWFLAPLAFPAQWLFGQLFWRIYMGRVLENVRAMAYAAEPYQYP
jgi:hypothetical protein